MTCFRPTFSLELVKRPFLLREQLLAASPKQWQEPVIIDEVQKVPQLLDEVHWLIENKGLQFILCGSSARKLKRGKANLLGGRAWRYEMHPLVSAEVADLNLLQALNRGMLPRHYMQEEYHKSLQAYVRDYLKEEVFAEGLSRNIPAFSRFFEAMGFSHGELDELCQYCPGLRHRCQNRQGVLPDPGPHAARHDDRALQEAAGTSGDNEGRQVLLVRCGRCRGHHPPPDSSGRKGNNSGRLMEHFILMEILAHRAYRELDYDVNFWRTKSGLEVDFILGQGEVAIEVKGTSRVDHADLRPLKAFIQEYAPASALVVCNERAPRVHEDIRILPWRVFLKMLWSGEVLS